MTSKYNLDINSFCNKVWILTVDKNDELMHFVLGENTGFFTIRFTPHHNIETLSLTGLPNNSSDYKYWEINPQKQEILLLDDNRNLLKRINPPKVLPDGTTIMQTVNSKNEFFMLDISDETVTVPPLNGFKMAYLFGSKWHIGWKEEESSLLSKYNFNIHIVPNSNIQLNIILDIQEHLMLNPSIQQVIIAGDPVILKSKISFNDDFPSDYIILSSNNLIVGTRTLILELLDALIVEIYQFQLSHQNSLPAWNDVLDTILNRFFKSRYKQK